MSVDTTVKSKAKDHYCVNCGEFVGTYVTVWREQPCCGSAECEREARSQEREAEDMRHERAAADGYERY